jgi:hypothetical protein
MRKIIIAVAILSATALPASARHIGKRELVQEAAQTTTAASGSNAGIVVAAPATHHKR